MPEIERQQKQRKQVMFRADAAFAKPEIQLGGAGRARREVRHWHPGQRQLERDIAEWLRRPGPEGAPRPSPRPVVWRHRFLYQAAHGNQGRQLVAKVAFRGGPLGAEGEPGTRSAAEGMEGGGRGGEVSEEVASRRLAEPGALGGGRGAP